MTELKSRVVELETRLRVAESNEAAVNKENMLSYPLSFSRFSWLSHLTRDFF